MTASKNVWSMCSSGNGICDWEQALKCTPITSTRLVSSTSREFQLSDEFSGVSFEEWSSSRSAYRRTAARKDLVMPTVGKSRLNHALSTLPDEYFANLKLIHMKTDLSEMYGGIEVSRGDIDTVLPKSPVNVASTATPGWMNDMVIETFLRIIAACKRLGGSKTVVVNNYVVEKLRATDIKNSAHKTGVDATTTSTIDTILFPPTLQEPLTACRCLPQDSVVDIIQFVAKRSKEAA